MWKLWILWRGLRLSEGFCARTISSDPLHFPRSCRKARSNVKTAQTEVRAANFQFLDSVF